MNEYEILESRMAELDEEIGDLERTTEQSKHTLDELFAERSRIEDRMKNLRDNDPR